MPRQDLLRSGIDLGPRWETVRLLQQKGQFEKADAYLTTAGQAASETTHGDIDVLIRLNRCYQDNLQQAARLPDLHDAARSLKDSIPAASTPEIKASAYRALGEIYLGAEKPDFTEADRCFALAEMNAPENTRADIRVLRGVGKFQAGELKPAEAFLDEATVASVSTRDLKAYGYLVLGLITGGKEKPDFGKADGLFAKAEENAERDQLGDIAVLRQLNSFEKVRAQFNSGTGLLPDTPALQATINGLEQSTPKASSSEIKAFGYYALALLNIQKELPDNDKADAFLVKSHEYASPGLRKDIKAVQGLNKYCGGKADEAEVFLERAVPAAPSAWVKASGYFALGMLNLGKEEPAARTKARNYFKQSLTFGFPPDQPQLCLAIIAAQEGDCDEIDRYVRQVSSRLAATDEDTKQLLAVAFFVRGACMHQQALNAEQKPQASKELFEKAKNDYDRALSFWEFPEVYPNRGYIYYHQLHQPAKSRADFERCITLDSKNDTAYYNLACWYALEGFPGKAIDNLKEALRLNAALKEDALRDTDFDKVRDMDEFKSLMK